MKACFADSYYFFALLNPRDEAHHAATTFNRNFRRPIVTTAWVLTEVADGLAATQSRELFPKLLRTLSGNPRATVVRAEQDLFTRGVLLYEDRPDKGWSLMDCISFVVMTDRGISDALTADRHFEQAGFVRLFGEGA